MRRNIFVIGLDDFHLEQLRTIRGAEEYDFHGLLTMGDVVERRDLSFDELVRYADGQLRAFHGPIDAIIGHWDFPTTTLMPILQGRFRCRGPSEESVLRCEHKYWSRLLQEEVAPEVTPAFAPLDPFAEDAAEYMPLDPPFWLKPVKAFSSYLGFRIGHKRDLSHAIPRIRDGIGLIAKPFDEVLRWADLPVEIAEVGAYHCIAEAIIGGRQCTLEGYVRDGEVRVYGIVDSVRVPHRSSFSRYQYPSELPESVQERMKEVTRKVMTHIGFDDGCFNLEMYWQKEKDKLWLLEINPRLSKSHVPLFELVDGASHHEVAVDVALGHEPDFPRREGRWKHAAKFMIRKLEDARVEEVATPEEIAAIERDMDVYVKMHVEHEMWLHALPAFEQDPYSYEVAVVFVGGDNRQQIRDRFKEVVERLGLRYSDDKPDLAQEEAAA
ncbi:MAG: ATP-grasp domain-containing protein [Myxococcota bacterium]